MERPVTQDSSSVILPGEESVTAAKATWRDYWELTKPGINRANLIAVFTGYWLAGYASFDLVLLLAVLLGTALVIAGGCVVNNFIDRDIDPLMERTRNRAVPAGRIKPQTALWMGIVLFILGMVVLAGFANPLAALLAGIGFLVYVFAYTVWTKRTTPWNTLVGSFSGALPPMIGWVAVTGTLDAVAGVLFMIMFVWQFPHFYALAILKERDYRAAGVPMLPVVKGVAETKLQIMLFTLMMLPASLLLYLLGAASWIYFISALILGSVWIILAFKGWSGNDQTWARKMFLFSLLYLPLLQVAMFVDPLVLG